MTDVHESGPAPDEHASGVVPGPGSGPGGAPAAVALTPILGARYRARDLDTIAAAAPGARLVAVSFDGHPDGSLDDVEVMLRGRLPADVFDRILARAPNLRWVHSATAGVERVLTPASRARGLVITNARGVFSRPIAEYVMMMILAVSRRLPELLELQHERTWQPLVARELRDITVGIVGLGSIGRAVGALATSFGCRVLATRKRPEAGTHAADGAGDEAYLGTVMLERVLPPDRLPELLAESDVIVLAAPLTPDTVGLIGDAAFGAMRPGAWVINVARGELVDERALARAIRDGRIGGAVLDTFREEPLPPTSPLYDLPNVILTPHTSWSSSRVLDRSVQLFCDNLRRYAAGESLVNVVDPEAGY
jgi:phosphoglycerate dehydrogenase-like enzyme